MIIDKTKPHAVFLDIDGTLMAPGNLLLMSEGKIPPKNISAIAEAQKLGHKILINTGRGYSCLPECVFTQVKFDGFVTGLGSFIELDGNTAYNCPIDKNMTDMLLDYIMKNKKPCRFQGKTSKICYDPEKDLSPEWDMIYSKQDFYNILGNDFISKITIDRELCGDYENFISSNLNLYKTGNAGEAASKGCNKANGMQKALDLLGIPRERSIAMGDSINDVEALLYAGTSVAMKNSDAQIKKICEYITSSDTDGGVGAAIELLLL